MTQPLGAFEPDVIDADGPDVERVPPDTIIGPASGKNADPSGLEIAMVFRNVGTVLTDWLSYTFNDNFLTPCAGFSFEIGGRSFDWLVAHGVFPGSRVSLRLGEAYVADGYIDSVELQAGRGGGITCRIEGRDRLGYAIDCNADPLINFKDGTTLEDALQQLLGRFGITKIVVDDSANQGLLTGVTRGVKYSAGGKKGPKPLKRDVLHQTKPYPGEGCFAFAARLAQRHGVWLWLAADGETLIASSPDYDSPPLYALHRTINGRRNVIDGAVRHDLGSQPTLIFADGYGGGGEFGHSRLRARVSNPICITADPAHADAILAYPDAKNVEFPELQEKPFRAPYARIVYLHDQSSQTPQQLENFLRREMSLHLRKSFSASYTVEGHGQIINGRFVPWSVNQQTFLDDEIGGYLGVAWIAGRTFMRRRGGGTTTKLDLLRPHSLELGEPDPDPTPAQKAAKAKAEEERKKLIDEAARQRRREILTDRELRDLKPVKR